MKLRFVLVAACFGIGCGFPTPSAEFTCDTTSDCETGRVCEDGFCIVAGAAAVDAAVPMPDGRGTPMPDADPMAMIIAQCMAKGYTLAAGPNGYYRSGGGAKQWVAAQTECAADVPGATHMIVLSTTAEVTFMAASPGWIGLSDRAVENTFVTVTNEPGDLRPFANGQPDDGSGSEDCVQIKSNGQLDDDQCNNTHAYVCECDGRASSL